MPWGGAAPVLGISPVCLLEERAVPGCSPDPRVTGSTLLPGSAAVRGGWLGWGLIFLHARMGASRKEKTTESQEHS